jgi:predicted esterase
MMLRTCLILSALAATQILAAEKGHFADQAVSDETRIDWVYVLSNQSPAQPPAGWLPDYRSSDQKYELYVPASYNESKPCSLVLFISPGDKGTGLGQWKAVCDREGAIFASPHGAGNETDTKKRVRIVLDVLDDIRRRYNVDPDRTYLGGFSGGGRIACAIGFSLPEYFGGVVPVCAAGDLREESWLRQRAIDRLSVALVTGETDFNRSEVERFRGPYLSDVGVRTKFWVTPKLGHGIPDAKALQEAFTWLDEKASDRKKLARLYPASRAGGAKPPTREAQAKALSDEAGERLQKPATKYSGLMQLKAVLQRWPDLPEADSARQALLKIEQSGDTAWEADDIAEQRRFLIARARRLGDYATGPLPPQYAGQRKDMAGGAIQLWQQVIDDGQDAKAAAEGKKALEKLQAVAEGK